MIEGFGAGAVSTCLSASFTSIDGLLVVGGGGHYRTRVCGGPLTTIQFVPSELVWTSKASGGPATGVRFHARTAAGAPGSEGGTK